MTTQKFNFIAQGDVYMMRVTKEVRDWLVRQTQPRTERSSESIFMRDSANRLIVGHSATGHHHVLEREPARMEVRSAERGMQMLRAIVKEPTEVKHLREHHTHAPVTLDPGEWLIWNQREGYQTESARRAAD